MLSPMLIIGLGGAGGKTIRATKQAIKRRLEDERYEGGIPAAWQFLQIDTTYDGLDFPAPMLPRDEFHSIVPFNTYIESIIDKVQSLGNPEEQHLLLTGWGTQKNETGIKVAYNMTSRAIGRLVGVANTQETLGALKRSIEQMLSPNAIASLKSVSEYLGSTYVNYHPKVFIISSLSGATGSGIFLDIVELLKRATSETWASESVAFLYSQEVFESLGLVGDNLWQNSLGAMNEVIASRWNPLSDRTEFLYEKLGVSPVNSSGHFGSKINFLIGARSAAGIDISRELNAAGMDEVFISLGQSLSTLIIDAAIRETFFSHVGGLHESSIDTSGLAPDLGITQTSHFKGIGFGKLSLGADRIVDYVADALTRRQLEKLLWPEMNPELLRDGHTKSSLVSEKASEVWPSFLLDSGLDEKGSQNQVIDALFPENYIGEITTFSTQLVAASVSDRPIDLAKFSKNLWSEYETNSPEFLAVMKEEVQLRAQSWVPSIQEKLRDQIAQELVTNGFLVVSTLLEKLISEISDHAIVELRREHQELAAAVQVFNSNTLSDRAKKTADGLSGVCSENRDFMTKIRQDLTNVLKYRIDSFVSDLAAALLADMLTYFFEPLQKAMVASRFELDDQRRKDVLDNGQSNPLRYFPEWGSGIVPSRYKPRTIERILINPDEYEDVYKHYASKDTSSHQPFEKSINFALLGRLLNVNPGEDNPQDLVEFSNLWSTSVRDAMAMGAAAAKLQVTLHTDLLELSERNRRWLKNDRTMFGQFTNMSIRKFVSADEDFELQKKREQHFVAAFSAMLGLSQPLVRLNSNAMTHVLNVDAGKPATGLMRESSKIPFDVDSNVGKKCIAVLLANNVSIADEGFAEKWFDPGDNAKTMYAISTTQASLPAWAFESLTSPIAEQAAQAKLNAGLWMQFWEGRRGRPLAEAVPFSTEIRRSIITGWFIARVFGLVEIEALDVGRGVKVWNPYLENPGWSTFPTPLLPSHRSDSTNTWVLPSLLTSAGLAYVEFGGTGSMAPLHPYQLLKFLGREVTTQIDGRDQWDAKGAGDELPTKVRAKSTALVDYVDEGKKPAESRELLKLLQETLIMDSNRQFALVKTIGIVQNQYKEIWLKCSELEWYALPHTWELKDDIDLALSDIRHYVMNLNPFTD